MIIVAIVALAGVVLAALYAVLVGFPSFPPELTSVLDQIVGYMTDGLGFVLSFTYGEIIMTLLGITVAVTAIIGAYEFIMWVVKKIPMFGVSD